MQYATLTLSELKVLASENNVIPTGDKRSKQAWIDALEIRQREEILATVEPTTDEEFEAALSERECLGEFSDSEMEAMAVAADIANSNTDMWADESALMQTVKLASTASEPAPVVEKVVNCKSTKKGAATVFASLLCIIIIAVQAVLYTACAIVQAAIHLKALFGSYNPDYDFVYQLRTLAQQRKTPTTAAA